MAALLSCCLSRDSSQLRKEKSDLLPPSGIGIVDQSKVERGSAASKQSGSGISAMADMAKNLVTGKSVLPENDAKPVEKWTVGWLPTEVHNFWRDHKSGFTEFWKKLRPQERVGVLRKINPYMPTRPGDDFINGQYIGVASRLCPELSIDTLVKNQGVGLVELFEERTGRVEEAQRGDIQLVSKLLSDGIVEGLGPDELAAERETRILQHLNLIGHVFKQRFDTSEKSIWSELKDSKLKTSASASNPGGYSISPPAPIPPSARPPPSAASGISSDGRAPWSSAAEIGFEIPNIRNSAAASENINRTNQPPLPMGGADRKQNPQLVPQAWGDPFEMQKNRATNLDHAQKILSQLENNNGFLDDVSLSHAAPAMSFQPPQVKSSMSQSSRKKEQLKPSYSFVSYHNEPNDYDDDADSVGLQNEAAALLAQLKRGS